MPEGVGQTAQNAQNEHDHKNVHVPASSLSLVRTLWGPARFGFFNPFSVQLKTSFKNKFFIGFKNHIEKT